MTIRMLSYGVLLLYPMITLLTPEPNWLRWWWRTGGGVPMPPEVLHRWHANQGNLLIAKFVILIAANFSFMIAWHIPPSSLGFRVQQSVAMIAIGVVAGLLLWAWSSSMTALAAKAKSRTTELPIFVMRETTGKILLIMVMGGFAEEFWRALALTISRNSAMSTGYAIFLTSLVFGIGHLLSCKSLGAALGRIVGPAVGGAFLAVLFLWTRTLFTPFTAHVLVNCLGTLIRRKQAIGQQTLVLGAGADHPADESVIPFADESNKTGQ